MSARSTLVIACAGLVAAGGLAVAFVYDDGSTVAVRTPRAPAAPPSEIAEPREPDTGSIAEPVAALQLAAADEPLAYVAVGGGAFPESTEVSLEQDLSLARQVLRGSGALLFAGGQGARVVRVEDPALPGDALLVQLGQLFQPRAGRSSRYELSDLPALAATRQQFERTLEGALARGDSMLTLYFAAHGEQGQTARDNRVVLWGGEALAVHELGALHDHSARPLRVIMASCYSGGFADLAFDDTLAERGAAKVARCGLFAGTWDRQTSGCDPNPDRAAQESYSLHFFQALRGRDRQGTALPASELDLDGDGHVSPLEAHTRARIASRSIDVPTTTSERYLRHVSIARRRDAGVRGRGTARGLRLALTEDLALIAQLGRALRLLDASAVEALLSKYAARLDELDVELAEAEAAVDDAFGALAARLLARWPVLDDAYHPQFSAVLHAEGGQIAHALEHWPEAEAYRRAQQALEQVDQQYWEAQAEEAPVLRLSRAYETVRLAAQLEERGGPALETYRALLACERAPLP